MEKWLKRPQAAPLCTQQVFWCQAHHVEEGCLLGSSLTAPLCAHETTWAKLVGCVIDMLCIIEGRAVERENHSSCPASIKDQNGIKGLSSLRDSFCWTQQTVHEHG